MTDWTITGPRLLAAIKRLMDHEYIDLGDLIYTVREREGLGWEGPWVEEWGTALTEVNAAIMEAES